MSSTPFPDDTYNYGLCALFTVVMQLTFFCVAYGCKFDLVTDFAGSTNFIALAWMTLSLAGTFNTRQVVLTSLLTLTRTELALFLLYRVVKREKDGRFDETRENFWKFLGFWIFQMVWAFVVTLPVIFVNGETV